MPDIRTEYAQEDFDRMCVKLHIVQDFVELLVSAGFDDQKKKEISLLSIAEIIKVFVDPVEEFLSWAYTYAEIPGEKEATHV
ncbi:hypothetical protein AGMMS49942_19750 [Spirochaetia bacterium]|nr:hypothetical protein AGMMS49942_19750 [Spirochaetia bacterium]